MESISIVFILSSIVIILTPGQDMILVMSRSILGLRLAFEERS